MNKDPIIVSIWCLTYNHEKYIRKALDGFVSQKTKYRFEVIIHDDASNDNTIKIIEEYKKQYPEIIKPIYEDKNLYSQGIRSTRRYLEKTCKGKYIAFCEGDDYWTDSNKLETQISFMEQHPECTLTYHPVNYVVDDDIVGNDIRFDSLKEVTVDEIIRGGGYYCATASLVVKRSVALEYPKFREIANVGDYPLQILAAIRGKVYYLPHIMGCYRKNHPNSWSTNFRNSKTNTRVNYFNKEIEWLSELNKETKGRYKDSVFYKIAEIKCNLYGFKSINRHDVELIIDTIKDKEDKKKLKRRLRRADLRRRYPFLFSLYLRFRRLFNLNKLKRF